jgi:hypothetical protein
MDESECGWSPDGRHVGSLGTDWDECRYCNIPMLRLPGNFLTEEDAVRFAARMREISEQTTREP